MAEPAPTTIALAKLKFVWAQASRPDLPLGVRKVSNTQPTGECSDAPVYRARPAAALQSRAQRLHRLALLT